MYLGAGPGSLAAKCSPVVTSVVEGDGQGVCSVEKCSLVKCSVVKCSEVKCRAG